MSSDGQRMRWSYTIVLKETAGAAIQFEQVERGSYASGIDIIEWQSPSARTAVGPATARSAMAGERWTGLSTGEGSGCHPLKLTLTIVEGEISGSATMQTSSVTFYWEATGKVLPGNAVVVTTTTGDRSMPGNVIRWEGTLTESALMLRQPSDLLAVK